MKPNTIPEIQEVINARLEGREIEMSALGNKDEQGWLTMVGGTFGFNLLKYRVKAPLTDTQKIAKEMGLSKDASVDDILSEIHEIRRQIADLRQLNRRNLD
jgi:hypothetical protein